MLRYIILMIIFKPGYGNENVAIPWYASARNFSTCRLRGSGARMAAAGKPPDNLCLPADAENFAALREQDGVPRGLAQVDDGLQRQRGRGHGESRLEVSEVGFVPDMTKRVRNAVEVQTKNLLRGIERQPAAPAAIQPPRPH